MNTVAQMYDFAADPANDMTYLAPETGREALKPFMIGDLRGAHHRVSDTFDDPERAG